jgi:O-methyltransferase
MLRQVFLTLVPIFRRIASRVGYELLPCNDQRLRLPTIEEALDTLARLARTPEEIAVALGGTLLRLANSRAQFVILMSILLDDQRRDAVVQAGNTLGYTLVPVDDRRLRPPTIDEVLEQLERVANDPEDIFLIISNFLARQRLDGLRDAANRHGYEFIRANDPRLRPPTILEALDQLERLAQGANDAALAFDGILERLVRPHHQSFFWGDRLLTLDKTVGFRTEYQFAPILASLNTKTGENQYLSPDGISWRLHLLAWAVIRSLRISGAIVECGTFRGDMAWVISEVVEREGADKDIWLYDTFEGFPPEFMASEEYAEAPEARAYAHAVFSAPGIYEEVCERFAKKPYVKIIKGAVPESFVKGLPKSIAFLHVDMNSAAAESAALERLWDRLTVGASVIFDDYGWTLHRRQKDAADGFATSRGQIIAELPTGQGLLIKQ